MKKRIYLDKTKIIPKSDLVFQNIFGKQGNEKITERLLSLIMEQPIEEIDLDVNKRLIGNHVNEKVGRLDVRAKLKNGKDFNIEIQVEEYESMSERLLYYWARLYATKLEIGKEYEQLTPTISILITDYKIPKLKDVKSYHTIWNLREKEETNKVLTPNLEIHLLEIPKIKEANKEKEELRAWLNFLVDPESKEVKEMANKDPFLKQAMEELNHLKNDPDFERLLESRADWLRDQYSFRKYAERKASEKGERKGERKGEKKGIQKGIQQGMIKGKEEVAKNMLHKKIPIKEIQEMTGLSEEEIKNIK